MHLTLAADAASFAAIDVVAWLNNLWQFLKVLVGFSIIIFVHELGHFLAAKWVGVRVERFAVGFTYRLFGWRRGEGFTFGPRPQYTADEMKERRWGETDYCFNALPFGGYVKMMGQDDILVDEKTGEMSFTKDPRAFTSRPVGQRMIVVSAGVIFNVIFAAILFMAIYLLGRQVEAPVLGPVQADSPAAQAGLMEGDRVRKIDGDEVLKFMDIILAQVLSDGPLSFEVERKGQALKDPIVVTPEKSGERKLHLIGVQPARTTTVIRDSEPRGDGKEVLKKGDRITHVNDQPVSESDGDDILLAYEKSRGEVVRLRVQRPNPEQPNAPPQEIEIQERPWLMVSHAEPAPRNRERPFDARHILGFWQRCIAAEVQPGTPAERAGMKAGDVVVEWGAISSPLYLEVRASIEKHAGKPVRVVVERGPNREHVELSITPARSFRLFGKAPAQAGIAFGPAESERPFVADVEPGTPAAALGMPRGSEILAIDGQPVSDWYAVANALFGAAGKTIVVRFRSGGDEAEGRMSVPSSIADALALQPGAAIFEIDGEKSVTTDDGAEMRLPNVYAVREMLRRKVGKTIVVRYAQSRTDAQGLQSGDFAVKADNIDPWQLRVRMECDNARFEPFMETLSANGNPMRALWMGVSETYSSLLNVYAMIRQMLKQNVGVENVSGPVGIFDHAIQQAKLGIVDLLHFLAFLSINLAVLNFLPFPLVDGGVMVFLLIEKIKGKPLSLNTQMGITLAGLALLLLCFLFVTFQDVSRLFG